MGNLKLAFFLAYKAILKGSRWTLALIILVTSLSFANLILTPSIMSGVTQAINKEQINTLFGHIIIDPPEGSFLLNDTGQILQKISEEPEIGGIAPHLNSTAMFEYNPGTASSAEAKTGNWNIIGIDPDRETQVTTIAQSLIAGSYLEPGDTDKIVLGVEIAGGDQAENKDFLTLGGVKIGDIITVIFPGGTERNYTVKGIFKARGGNANNLAFVSRQELASALNIPANQDAASQILIRLINPDHEQQIISKLNTLLTGVQVRSWSDYGGGIGNIVSSFGVVASLIGGIGLVVAGVVMFIVIYINVANRRRQIGILRAIGINHRVVLGSYLLQALLYGISGIILGGLIFGYIIKPFFDSHPIDLPIGLVSLAIDPGNIRNAVIGLILASILAGIFPVLNITRNSIIRAIWGN